MKIFAYSFLLFLMVQTSIAQEQGENQLGAWYMYSGTYQLSEKYKLSSAVQLWDYEPTNNFHLFLILVGTDYAVTPNISASVGYGYAAIDRSYQSIPYEDVLREHRLYEQLTYKSTFKKLQIGQRYRIEHRYLYDTESTNLVHRNRYRLQFILPISDTFFVNVYDEIFWRFESDFFDQNRIYAALGIYMSNTTRVQFGYLKHQLNHATYNRLQIVFTIKADLRKHKNKAIANYQPTLNFDQNQDISD